MSAEQHPLEIECCKVRKCKWRGRWADLVEVRSKRIPGAWDKTCPNCGGKEFYRIETKGDA